MSNKVAKSKEVFNNTEPEYDRYYFDESTGGFVLVHKGHNRGESFDSELFVAEVFAKNGSQVRLLDESNALEGKRPDAEIDGEIWDFKRLTRQAKAFANRVQAGIREARHQGAIKVAYHIDRDDYDLEEIKRGVGNALDLDIIQQVKVVVLILPSGKLILIQRGNL